jgi:heme/copper-type cytochrome/quinol oxidase subunit 2
LKFLDSPAAFVSSVVLAIIAFGAGLTSPIWLLLGGKAPVEAMRVGTPIVTMSMVGLVVMVALGVVVQRLRKPRARVEEIDVPDAAMEERKHRIVHIVTMLMFIVPFATIILGVLLKSVIDADSRGRF